MDRTDLVDLLQITLMKAYRVLQIAADISYRASASYVEDA
jgi:hypothetical protein